MSLPNGSNSAAAEVLAYEREVKTALKRFGKKSSWEPETNVTPLSRLLESEDGQLEEWAIQNETARRLLDWIAGDGPHPAALLRRLYLVGHHMMVAPYCELTLRDKAMMCGDSHGAQHWRMKRLCNNPLARKGALSRKAVGQKSARASAAAAEAARGNHNRANGHGAVGKNQPNRRP